MHIQHKQTESQGLFFIQGEGEEIVAELTYHKREPGTLIIEHTEVDEELRGKNIGFQLVHAAVEYARTHKFKIIPLCVFAKAVIDKKPDFQDILEA